MLGLGDFSGENRVLLSVRMLTVAYMIGGMKVLKDEDDFYELGMTYFQRAHASHIRYAEIMFDIQAHTRRGIAVLTVMNGLERAQTEAETYFNVSEHFIPSMFCTLFYIFSSGCDEDVIKGMYTDTSPDQVNIHSQLPSRPAPLLSRSALQYSLSTISPSHQWNRFGLERIRQPTFKVPASLQSCPKIRLETELSLRCHSARYTL